MSARNDLRDTLRDDERRRREEARVLQIQTQLDELRGLVRELITRQGRGEEQFKFYEVGLAELRASLEQHRHEVQQAGQARQLEDARIRQQLSELDERIDENAKPVRTIQAHVAEVVESIRRGRDDNQAENRRYEELKSSIEHVAAQAERNADMLILLRETQDALRNEQSQHARDILKVDDAIRIVEQDARRRATEITQEIDNLAAQIKELRPIFGQLEAMIEDVRESIVHIDPALAELEQADETIREELTRIYSQALECDELQSERHDELRVQLDVNVRDLRQLATQQHTRLDERLDHLGDNMRELTYRLSLIDMRLDELRDADVRLRRELWHAHEMRTRMRLDQIQAELESVVDDRRQVEAELSKGGASAPAQPRNNSGGVN
jgi:chromosome segregation ATPase